MKITGAQHDSSLVPDTLKSNEDTLPEACTSSTVLPYEEDATPHTVPPILMSDDLDFDEFLADAAEWL